MTERTDSSRPSPALDALEADFLARLALARRKVSERIHPIESALERYRRSLEEEEARKLSMNHSLVRSTDLKLESGRALELLLKAVQELAPEVSLAKTEDAPAVENLEPANAPAAPAPTTTLGRFGPSARVSAPGCPAQNILKCRTSTSSVTRA